MSASNSEPGQVTDAGRPDWTAQPALETDPLLGCDLPIERPGTIVHNVLSLSGWAASRQGISGVVVQVDDRAFNATYGLETPWVAESMADVPGASHAGYSLQVDTSDWEPGLRKVTVTAFDGEGRSTALRGSVELIPFEEPRYSIEDQLASIAAGRVAMWLENPPIVVDHCEVASPVEVSGWAYCRDGLDAVIVTVDGRASYRALRPIAHPDLLDDYGAEVASGAGFALKLHPSELAPGRHTLSVVGVGFDGHAVGVTGDMTCLPERDEPAPSRKAEVEWLDAADPPPSPVGAGPRDYDPERHAGTATEAEHRLRYLWASSIVERRKVLDVGCAEGSGTALLAAAGAEHVVALDDDREALDKARGRLADARADVVSGNPHELPFDDATFDVVTCFGVIDRLGDPELALEELRRVVRHDGVVLVSSRRRRRELERGGDPQAPTALTPGELERSMRARFACVRVLRQQTCLASAVLDDESMAVADETSSLGIDVRRLATERPGGEAHTLILAGDGELPDMAPMAALASPSALYRLHDRVATWQDRALLAEADAAASRAEAHLAVMAQEGILGTLGQTDDELHRTRTALQASTAELEQATARADALRRELEGQAAAYSDRTAELTAATERAARAEASLTALTGSLSWRSTRPLRGFMGALRRARRVGRAKG
jgi:SAM-dependent methyltransferase